MVPIHTHAYPQIHNYLPALTKCDAVTKGQQANNTKWGRMVRSMSKIDDKR